MTVDKNEGKVLVDSRLDIKVLVSGLWVVLMLLYLYCDIYSFFKPGAIGRIMEGFMGPFQVNQAALVSAAVLMIIPPAMVFLSLCLKAKVNRWLNIVAGLLYTVVGVWNVIGETWIYYILFAALELVVTASIVALSIKWPRVTTNTAQIS